VRTCAACRVRRPQQELLRIRLVDATLVIDDAVRGPGRGAYLCPLRACVERARARDASALRRALRSRPERLDTTALDALQARLATQERSSATEGAQTP
jgi:predicted RNA-binding protein YlxR (DUF448 family)